MPNRVKGDWWKQSLTAVSGCNWPPGERPEECRNCFSGPMCERFPAIHGNAREIVDAQIINGRPVVDAQPVGFHRVLTHPDRLAWLKPTGAAKTWLCSIAGDLFHPDVPDSFIYRAIVHIREVQQVRSGEGCGLHRVAILTKRYERAAEFCRSAEAWPANTILMPSAGTQDSVDRACRAMARLPEGIRWGLHCEPMLEELDLCAAFDITSITHTTPPGRKIAGPGGLLPAATERPRPSWIVAGGETNVRNRRKARPCHPDWVRGIRDQCAAAGVPFWFKSWGEYAPVEMGPGALLAEDPKGQAWRFVGKARAGRILDGRTHDATPEAWKEYKEVTE